jgi:hypothetical protein
MSLSKRIVYDASSLSHPNVYEDSTSETVLADCNMSRILGAFHQLVYITGYAAEVFDNLMLLSADTSERITQTAHRISKLYDEVEAIEVGVHAFNLGTEGHSGADAKAMYLKNRDGNNFTVLSPNTNCAQLMSQYERCNYPPAFWKLESFGFDHSVAAKYSSPGTYSTLI